MQVIDIALIAILVSMALVIIRGILGPSIQDRLLAVNAFGSNTVIAIALLAFMVDNMMFIDIALVYALINFTSTIAMLKFFRYGSFDHQVVESSDDHILHGQEKP